LWWTPNLAESWESSADAKTWRFKISQGVVFSNGKSLTMEDVIDSVNVHRGEDSKSATKGVFLASAMLRLMAIPWLLH
jgi:peptide/nickel transport system substrate-binding protein